ncbi:hypothetical protein ABC977_01995 [Thioalkalicoccus limnaeus]|uniref:IcmF-related N-terminal domain-containing protein n=1 Tax=Thioalkalicoccus limnaeus TaxID=120681 RepID=A0ABV4B9V9_9GAMM
MLYKYRFALYGLSGAGKTCVLAAMSMSHGEQPHGMTCSPVKEIAGLPDNERRQLGLERIRSATQSIEKGSVPVPTAAEMMILTYSLTERGRGEYQIELSDYPGELLRLQGNELADQLFEQMQTMDGILILAEMPHEREDNEAIYRQIEHLDDAITKLRHRLQSQKNKVPVVLLINKWDRQSGALNYVDPADEERKLDAYLNQREPSPPHRKLIQTLQNSVGEHNVRVLPMSAFGQARIDPQTGDEVPLHQRPLQSFYLLEGFRWLVNRHDTLRLERIAQRFDNDSLRSLSSRQYSPKERLSRWLHFETIKDIDAASEGFSAEAAPARVAQLAALRRRAVKRKRTRLVSVSTLGFLIISAPILTLIFLADYRSHSSLESRATQPNATLETKQEYQDWLSRYIANGSPRLYRLKFSRKDAREELRAFIAAGEEQYCAPFIQQTGDVCNAARDCLRQYPFGDYSAQARTKVYECDAREQKLREQTLWAAVESAEAGSVAQRSAASDYLGGFPTGRYAAEANSIIARYDSQVEWNEFASAYDRALKNGRIDEATTMLLGRNQDKGPLQELKHAYADRVTAWLDSELRQIKQAQDWDRLERLEHQVQQLRQLPPDLLTSRQAQEIFEKVAKANDEQDQLDADQMSARIDHLLGEGKFRSAFETMLLPNANPRIQELKHDFQRRIPTALERHLRGFRASNNWDRGNDMLSEVTSLPLDDSSVRSKIRDLEQQFRGDHDRSLYTPCQQNPSIDRCQDYIAKAPLKTMERAAQQYIDFASKQNIQQSYTLTLQSIRSPRNYGRVKVSVRFDHHWFIDEEFDLKEDTNRVGRQIPVIKKPSDRVDIAVELNNLGMSAFWNRDLGKRTDNLTLDRLRQQYDLCVPHPKQKTDSICLNFALSGLAAAPTMPQWGG